jgi:hypothetical protein
LTAAKGFPPSPNNNNNNKGPYKKPRRDIALREIRRLIINESLTNRQISERLNIPLRTIERYIHELYEHDNELLAGLNSDEQVLTATNLCQDRMIHYKQEILANICHNKEAPFKDQLAGWHLVCELEAALLRLLDNAVELVARRSARLSGGGAGNGNNRLVTKGSTVVNLQLRAPQPTTTTTTTTTTEEDEEEEQQQQQ